MIYILIYDIFCFYGSKIPTFVKVKAFNRDGEEFLLEAHDYFAKAICHEIDHLDGILYVDRLFEDERNSFAQKLKKLSDSNGGVR